MSALCQKRKFAVIRSVELIVQPDGASRRTRGVRPSRHCEPTGPARSGRPDDKLREAIQQFGTRKKKKLLSLRGRAKPVGRTKARRHGVEVVVGNQRERAVAFYVRMRTSHVPHMFGRARKRLSCADKR
jgi:hypothetical protein